MPKSYAPRSQVDFIDNSSVRLNTLITDELKKSDKVRIAVAYATIPKNHEFTKKLKDFVLEKKGEAEVIVGLGYENTNPKCLEALLAIQERSKGRLLCKVSSEEKFHPKLYIFEKFNGQVTVIIGSSNLTPEGLNTNIEANVVTYTNGDDRFLLRCKQFFSEDLWRSKTLRRLSSEIISNYKRKYTDKQKAIKSSRNAQHIKRLRKSLDDALSEELTPWNGFDRDFMDHLERLCRLARREIRRGGSYFGFRGFNNHILVARFFDTLIQKMAQNGFLYLNREKARYPEEEVLDEMWPNTSAYFQRCFVKKKWKDFCRLFVYFIFGQEETKTCTGSLVICLDFVGKTKGLHRLVTKISNAEGLQKTIRKCKASSVQHYVLYSSEKYGPLKDIEQLGSLPMLIRRNAKWNRVSFEHYVSEDLLQERKRLSGAELLNDIVAQCNRFSKLSDFVLG